MTDRNRSAERAKDVPSLEAVRNEPDPDVVEIAEEFLAMAKRGDVVAGVVCLELRGREVCTMFARKADGDYAHVVCAIEKMKMRLLT